jgi:ferric-dicitrate binding protein FerR (iron transport regulator)
MDEESVMKKIMMIACFISAWTAIAAEQIGTVSGAGLTLRGQPVPGVVNSLPLTSGDEIATGAGQGVISLLDKSTLLMSPSSRLRIRRDATGTTICLLSGTIQFAAAPDSHIVVCAQGQSIALEPDSEGTVMIEAASRVRVATTKGGVQVGKGASCGCGVMTAAGKAAVIVGAAAAGGAVAAGVLHEPEPVSRSKP